MLSRSFLGLGRTPGVPEGAGEGSGAQGVGVNLGFGIRGATRPRADQASAPRPFPGRWPARSGERAGERALTGRCRAA